MTFRAAPRVLAVIGLLLALLWGLLAVPASVIDWADLGGWLERTPAEDALVAAVRLVAISGTMLVLAASALYVVAVVAKAPALVRLVGGWTLPAVRRAVDAAMVSTVAVGLMTATPAHAMQSTEPAAEQLAPPAYVPVPAGEVYEPTEITVAMPAPAATQGEETTANAPTPADAPSEGAPVDAFPLMVADLPPAARTYVVQRGDSLWKIARVEVTRVTSAEPTEQAIARYWLALMEANRARLTTGDPNRIYAGERLEFPDVE
jgi:nucleoid-associated protein YgaU